MTTSDSTHHDVLVVGAGFGGMYAVWKFRELGYDVAGLEAGGDVGGVWYWNRYPGARCDLQSVDYSYGFHAEVQQEWSWSEQFAAQPEILAYANFVADRLDLRSQYRFETRVTAAVWDEGDQCWRITTDTGQTLQARFCVMATGPLSVPKDPEIPGLDTFGGELLRAQKWPHHPVDFAGKRVGVIGTGSTGIQIVQEVGRQAEELFVFQRTPSWTLPMRNHRLSEEYTAEMKRHYPALRQAMRVNPTGGTRPVSTRPYFSLPPEQRRAVMDHAWEDGGHTLLACFGDLLTNEAANDEVSEYVREKIEEVVDDSDTAEALKPRGYPIFARRVCLDTDYYETYNLPGVHLMDCLKDPIVEVTESGVRTENGETELDMLILATGYDALTGALLAFDIVGRDGCRLVDKWSDGPETFLGLMVEDFPNMFTTCGPNSPAALANIITISEHDVDWIADLVGWMGQEGHTSVQPSARGVKRWMDEVHRLAAGSLIRKANTWWTGGNVEGKTRGLTMYVGGFNGYQAACEAVAKDDYLELEFGVPTSTRPA